MNPLVSIVIPSYNHSEFVKQAVLSAVNQTYKNIEIIVIDDGSSDDSRTVIRDILSARIEDLPTIYYYENNNQGLVKTLNEGIRRAKGQYISFLASDDAYLPHKIEHSLDLLSAADHPYVAIYTDGYLINAKSQNIGIFSQRYLVPFPKDCHKELLIGSWIPALGLLYKRSIFDEIGGFNEALKVEDYDFLLRLTRRHKLLRSKARTFLYRIHGRSTSADIPLMCEQNQAVERFHTDLFAYRVFVRAIKNKDIYQVFRSSNWLTVELAFRDSLRRIQYAMQTQDLSVCEFLRIVVRKLLSRFTSTLRVAKLKLIGAHVPWSTRIHGTVTVYGSAANITFSEGVLFLGDSRLITSWAGGRGVISVGANVTIDKNACLEANDGFIEVGNGAHVGFSVVIQGRGGVKIAEHTMIGPHACLLAANHVVERTSDIPFGKQGYRSEGIVIKENCWLGAGVIVLDGSILGANTVVGANCVVRKETDSGSLVVAKGVLGAPI